MTKKKFLLIGCLILLPWQQLAADDQPPTNVKDRWDKNGDGDRSLSCTPSLTRDEFMLYLHSTEQLENLYIGITDLHGNVYYSNTVTIQANANYTVSIDNLPSGQYYFSIVQESRYIVWSFII